MSKDVPIPNFAGFGKDLNLALTKKLPRVLSNNASNFFKKSFRNQGFTDRQLKPWAKTKSKSNRIGKSSGILIGSGLLKGSVRNTERPGEAIVVAGNQHVPYARIHNEGGMLTIQITQRSRKYFWAMWYKSGKKNDFWKNMALTKKDKITIRIPKRQFMGNSVMLNQENEQIINKTLTGLFKKHF